MIAVVGTGAVTALGPTANDLWDGAVSGRVGVRPVRSLPMGDYRTRVAGEVETVPECGDLAAGFRDRAVQFALAAAKEALAGLGDFVPAERCGLVLGTCNAGLLAALEWVRLRQAGLAADPRLVATSTPQALAEALAVALGFGGPVLAVNTACASGTNAIGLASDMIRLGCADLVVAGGTDGLSEVVLAGFDALGSLSVEPATPYAGTRSGLSLGEGSGMLALAHPDIARRAGWPVLADVLAYGLSADGFHITAPRPDGSIAAQAMSAALTRAGADASEIGYVNGHGTGTDKNDVAETRAIRLAFGTDADQILVSSTKSMIGHLLGAAGAVEAIVTARAVAEAVAPPTAGYTNADPDCDLNYVVNGARTFTRGLAVSNSFAFGGANVAVLLGKSGSQRELPPVDTDRVVVTGLSVLSPAGDGVDNAWRMVETGVHGYHLGRVEIDPATYLDRKARRRMDRLAMLSVITADMALAESGLKAESDEVAGVGMLFGTGVGPMEAMAAFALPVLAEGRAAADPGLFPNTVYNQAAGRIATHLGLRGPTCTLSVGHATGSATIAYAADLVAAGHADAMVVTVTDTLSDAVVEAYAANGVPAAYSLSEGSVTLILERRDEALARGATVLGEILGSGMAFDAKPRRPWNPRGTGIARAMRTAMGKQGLEDVDTLWLNACGLDWADRAEQRALRTVFSEVPMSFSPKATLGDPMGVGGALSTALALHRFAHDPSQQTALVNSSSFGGTHVSLLLGRAEGTQ